MKKYQQLTSQYQQQLESGEFEQAVMTANRITDLQPDNADGYNMLAHALKQCNQLEAALKCYELSLLMDNHQVNVHLVVGEILAMQGRKQEAYQRFLTGMEMTPDKPQVMRRTGSFLIDAGHLDEAEVLLEKAFDAGLDDVVFELLDLYEKKGDLERVRHFMAQHQAILQGSPQKLSPANAWLALGEVEKALFYLKRIEPDTQPLGWQRAYFNLLGQTYEKKGFYAQAFNCFERQNRCSTGGYDPKQAEQLLNRVIDTSNRVAMKDKMAVQGQGRDFAPLFIVGLPRSGTSLLEHILNVHPQLLAAGELNFIESAFNSYAEHKKPLPQLAEWYQDKCEYLIHKSGQKPQALHWVSNKMPSNFMYLGFILEMLPNARILHCKRDPLDNGLSIYKQNFADSHRYATNQRDIAHFIALERKLMKIWQERYPQAIMTVDYETLVCDFERQTDKIFEFLQLQKPAALEQFYRNPTLVNTASYQQVRQPLNTQAIGASQHYARQLEPLRQQLGEYQVIETPPGKVQQVG